MDMVIPIEDFYSMYTCELRQHFKSEMFWERVCRFVLKRNVETLCDIVMTVRGSFVDGNIET